jgi:hypothetical protein
MVTQHGQRARNFSKYGPTVLTPVCCSMISDSQTRYGSARSPASGRHGNRRRWRSYQSSSSAGREVPRSLAICFFLVAEDEGTLQP